MKKLDSIMNFLYINSKNALEIDGELPISALIFHSSKGIISYASNQTEKLLNFTKHAEILAIEKACLTLDSKHLDNCEIYVSHEPCLMCLHALNLSKIQKIFFGSYNFLENPIENYLNLMRKQKISASFDGFVFGGFHEKKFSQLLSDFFAKKRKK
jgi:tRNA(adenine34) deaminase